MTTVSVNAYCDAELLDECLASVRAHLPDARIQVVDGRYDTWPHGPVNSDDGTEDVAAAYDAEYIPIGPVADERAKHLKRIDLAPNGERLLFIDADERLLSFEPRGLPAKDAVARVRIFNALMYGPRISYYPRYFYPRQMESIPRVDRFSFDAPIQRTDAITIVHRADLRDDRYRDAKLDRFDTEDRDSWYKEYLQTLENSDGYLQDMADFETCPECGRESVTRSRICGHGEDLSEVVACTAGDGCYRAVEPVELNGYRYVPDALGEGFAEDVPRVRAELIDAGYDLAATVPEAVFDRYEPNARRWVRENVKRQAIPDGA